MLDNELNETIDRLKADGVEAPPHLRAGVWARIAAGKADQPRNRLERVLAAIFTPQHHVAAVTAAGVLGIISSVALTALPDSKADAYFDVFSSHYALSPTKIIRNPR